MVMKIALGIVIGTLLARLLRHRRRCCRPTPGHGWRHGRWPRLLRELGLTPEQLEALRPVWLSARSAVAELRFSHIQAAHALGSAAFAEPLDRARLDQIAERHADDQARAGRDLVQALARAHEVLTPEQRARLRARLSWLGFAPPGGFTGGDGPYRSVSF